MPYTDSGRVPYTDRGGVPYTDRGGVPYTDRGRVPYTDRGRVPYTDRGGVPYTDRGRVHQGAPRPHCPGVCRATVRADTEGPPASSPLIGYPNKGTLITLP